jgi:hypothetical protein
LQDRQHQLVEADGRRSAGFVRVLCREREREHVVSTRRNLRGNCLAAPCVQAIPRSLGEDSHNDQRVRFDFPRRVGLERELDRAARATRRVIARDGGVRSAPCLGKLDGEFLVRALEVVESLDPARDNVRRLLQALCVGPVGTVGAGSANGRADEQARAEKAE